MIFDSSNAGNAFATRCEIKKKGAKLKSNREVPSLLILSVDDDDDDELRIYLINSK